MIRQSLVAAAVAAACVVAPLTASAQSSASTSSSMSSNRSSPGNPYSLIPFTTRGYVGASVGKTEYDLPCPFATCEDPDVGFKAFAGGAYNEVIGLELGYINFGDADRAGGQTKAQGAYLSVIGNIPVSDVFNLFARVGTTYGFTDVSTAPSAGPSGKEDAFSLHYGVGVGLDLGSNWGLVGEWEQHRLKFVGGRDNVSMYSLGVKYRF